ncbi:MAG: Gx transporter family protein [Oscillospiraceae bacterium]
MSLKRITRASVFAAIALTIFMVELQIPSPVPIPGVKLGLANIVTVCSMFLLGPADTAAILLVRIVLGSIFSGNMMTIFYSLSGGLMCYLVMLVMRKLVTEKQIWVCSVLGAIAHNIGQIAAAIIITRTPSLISYLPVLMISGVIAGIFTGLCAQFLTDKLRRARPHR